MSSTVSGDLVLLGGTIRTFDPRDTVANALAVKNGRILAVGSVDGIQPLVGSGTDVIQLEGACVVPGFTENHMHVREASIHADWLDLTPSRVSSMEDIVAIVKEAAKATPSGEWILGWGFNHDRLRERRYPTRHDLDRATTTHPLALKQVESMSWTANTQGLRRMGIGPKTPDPPGGWMLRDEHGEPLGPMWDNCRTKYVFPALPQPSSGQLVDLVGRTLKGLNRVGVTAVDDAGVISSEQIEAYQRLRREGLLTARINMNLYVAYGDNWDDSTAAHAVFTSGLSTGFGDDYLRIGPAVIGVDGGTGNKRALLYEPYLDSGDDYGSLRVSPEFLREFCVEAQRRGYQIGAVAHGDRAIDLTLDAFEEATATYPRPNTRHRLEHAYLWNPDSYERAARLEVVLSSQPAVLSLLDRTNTLDAWGPERSRSGFPYRSALNYGLVASGGSDCPLVSPDPLLGIYELVYRRICQEDGSPSLAPEQALSLREAIRVYTWGGAYGMLAEDRWGSLEPGKYADFVILDRDPVRAKTALLDCQVLATYLEGRPVYRQEEGDRQ